MKKQASTSRGRGVPRSGEARGARSARIAPNLRSYYAEHRDELLNLWGGKPSVGLKAADAELRALLAVARAAQRLRFSPGVVTGDVDALARALSRLARAGKSRGDER